MKKLLLSVFSFLSLSLTVSQAKASIVDWDSSIPMDSKIAVMLITSKVEELTYSDEGDYCGGQSSQHRLVDYFTTEDVNGNLTFFLKVTYQATLSLDFCRSEVVKNCESTIRVDDQGQIKVGQVICQD